MEAIRPILRECYDFIADVIFEKQFTGQEYIDGMDARIIENYSSIVRFCYFWL